ncbi:BamA/TamA family outer membrane protein [Catalinimonas sp. 4WD22]|uniref:translocation and assembly module lipoprotein TamL n=1 Tax=Catalinimonas locisalis TaxID=3133978 RepID=UPI003101013F
MSKGLKYSLDTDHKRGYILFFALILLSACSTTRSVPEKDYLYLGHKKIEFEPKGTDLPALILSDIEEIVDDSPNGSTALLPFRLPVGLWINNFTSPDAKSPGGWMNRHWARQPVLLSTVNPEMKVRLIERKLSDAGYLKSHANYQLDTSANNKKVKVSYMVKPGKRYYVAHLQYPEPTSYLDSILHDEKGKGKLKENDPLVIEALLQERERLTEVLKDHGFVDFRKEFLQFVADSSGHKINIELRYGETATDSLLHSYSIDKIIVYLDKGKENSFLVDSTSVEGIIFYYHQPYVKLSTLAKGIAFSTKEKYSPKDENDSYSYLSALGIFRTISIDYQKKNKQDLVDVLIQLVPQENIRLAYEMNMVSKSNNFVGPGLSISLGHRNAFGGAEKLNLTLDFNIEWLLGYQADSQIGFSSYGLGLNLDFQKPGLIMPFYFKPKDPFAYTKFEAGVNLLSRLQYYRMISWNTGFEYHWKTSRSQSFEVKPLDISYTHLIETTPEFDSLLLENPLIRRSFEEQFVFGASFTSITNHLWQKNHQFYWENSFETAGNLLSLLSGLVGGKPEDGLSRAKVLNNPYAQFVKFSTDFRYYFHLMNKQRLVSRLFVGIGLPYGNSNVIPYFKQYFSGGSNSVRAFRARSLGPGTYYNSNQDNIYYEQTGDIKIEANAEYRFPLSSFFAGALFLDAGNIWLLNYDPARPGGQFRWNRFLDEMAIGTGVGFRLDIDFFVLRLDFGYALKQPYRPKGDRWIFGADNFDPSYFLHFAIGYPF